MFEPLPDWLKVRQMNADPFVQARVWFARCAHPEGCDNGFFTRSPDRVLVERRARVHLTNSHAGGTNG